MAAGDGEAWLAGALVFSEDAPVAALFVAPDAGRERAVLVRPSPADRIAWLSRIELPALGFASEPPSSIEHDGERYERERRLPLRAERHGEGAPAIEATALLLEYRSPGGGKLVMVVGEGFVASWAGRELGPGMFDVLPAPDAATP